MDDWDRVRDYAVHVTWRGPRGETGRGGYAVTRFGGQEQMSRKGEWKMLPEPFIQRHYRWETFEEALDAARANVDAVRIVNGMTWPEFVEWCELRMSV
jgi:hypothetical protein